VLCTGQTALVDKPTLLAYHSSVCGASLKVRRTFSSHDRYFLTTWHRQHRLIRAKCVAPA